MRQCLDKAATYRVRNDDENDRDFPGLSQQGCRYRSSLRKNHVRCRSHQFSSICAHAIGVGTCKAHVNSDRSLSPSKLLQALSEGCDVGLRQWVFFGEAHKHTDTRYTFALLRPRRQRPRRRAAEQGDKVPPPHHSITSSARASSVGGTWSPRAFAVFRLI